MSWAETLRAFRRSVLGLNRRNADYVFRYNPRDLFHLVDNKIETKRALTAAGIPVPRSYALFEVQWDLRRLGWAVRRLSDFVLKPARASGGGGILAITRHDGELFYKASGASLRLRDLEDHVSDILAGAYSRNQRQDEAILEYRVRPDPAIGAISFGGVADFRVLVFFGVPLMAMLRLPTRRSDGRANLHMGGIGVGVDLVTGRTLRATGPDGPVERHPDLGVPLVGIQLPSWEAVLDISTRCYDALGLGYFGADIVLDADHGPMVLEVNGRPGLGIQLANDRGLRPLLDEIERRQPRDLAVAERIVLGKEIFAAAA
ncbi:MAG: alpha-L-glutamate ligase-like protein [Candidatus Binatia bacterium]